MTDPELANSCLFPSCYQAGPRGPDGILELRLFIKGETDLLVVTDSNAGTCMIYPLVKPVNRQSSVRKSGEKTQKRRIGLSNNPLAEGITNLRVLGSKPAADAYALEIGIHSFSERWSFVL